YFREDSLLLDIVLTDCRDDLTEPIQPASNYPVAKCRILPPSALVSQIGKGGARELFCRVGERHRRAKPVLVLVIIIVRLHICDERGAERRLRRTDELKNDLVALKDRHRWPLCDRRRRAVDIQRARLDWDTARIEIQTVAFNRPHMTFADDVADLT